MFYFFWKGSKMLGISQKSILNSLNFECDEFSSSKSSLKVFSKEKHIFDIS